MLKPDLEIFKSVKGSLSSFKRKLLPFASHYPGLLFFCLGETLALLSPQFIPWVSWRGVSLSLSRLPWWLLLFLRRISLKSLTFEIPAHSPGCAVLTPDKSKPRFCAGWWSAHDLGLSSIHAAIIPPKVSQRASARIKDDLSIRPSSFHVQELCELFLLIFLHIAVLSQLGTMCGSVQLFYLSSRSFTRRLII